MRACLYIGPCCGEWNWKFFPSRSPGELPVAGKSWIRHMADQCSCLGIRDIYIADCYAHDDPAARTDRESSFFQDLHRLPSIPCARPEQLLKQHEETIRTDQDLLIFWGQTMPDLPDAQTLLSDLREVRKMPDVLPEGVWLLRGGRYYECVCPLLRMRSLKEYFDLNFRLLEKPGIYNLPGYSNEEGCVFGMDVLILPDCELESPVLIQDNVRLEREVSLRGGVIVGKDVMINENSSLEHSIVLDHTYIGKYMFFRNKIIDGSRVIDVPTESMVDLDDEFLTGSSNGFGFNRYKLTEFMLALILAVGGLPLFLLTRPFRRWLDRLAFFFFAFQVYPKCWQVLGGRASLVRYGHQDSNYAFRYSDQWILHQEEHQKTADDIYYYYNRSVGEIWKTVVASLAKRLFILSALPSDDRSRTAKENPL